MCQYLILPLTAMAKVDTHSNPGPIIGGVVAVVIVVTIALTVLFIYRRRLRYLFTYIYYIQQN